VYARIYAHIYTHTHKHTHTHTHTRTCTQPHTHTHTQTHTHSHKNSIPHLKPGYASLCLQSIHHDGLQDLPDICMQYIQIQTNIRTHIHTHIHTMSLSHTRTPTHTHLHACTHKRTHVHSMQLVLDKPLTNIPDETARIEAAMCLIGNHKNIARYCARSAGMYIHPSCRYVYTPIHQPIHEC